MIKTLSWLTITELMSFSIANCRFSALHDPNWPKYLPIQLQVSKRTTRKDNEMMVEHGKMLCLRAFILNPIERA